MGEWGESFFDGAWAGVQLEWAASTEPFGIGADRLTLVATKGR